MKHFKRILLVMFFILGIIWLYTGSLIGVKPEAKRYLNKLELALEKRNLSTNYFIVSGRRFQFDNWILTKLSGAVSKSRHLKGEAIDLIILDINDDGNSDAKDVNLVYEILDKEIIKNRGGIGTYKNESDFFSRQMIHFDCRGKRARWHR